MDHSTEENVANIHSNSSSVNSHNSLNIMKPNTSNLVQESSPNTNESANGDALPQAQNATNNTNNKQVLKTKGRFQILQNPPETANALNGNSNTKIVENPRIENNKNSAETVNKDVTRGSCDSSCTTSAPSSPNTTGTHVVSDSEVRQATKLQTNENKVVNNQGDAEVTVKGRFRLSKTASGLLPPPVPTTQQAEFPVAFSNNNTNNSSQSEENLPASGNTHGIKQRSGPVDAQQNNSNTNHIVAKNSLHRRTHSVNDISMSGSQMKGGTVKTTPNVGKILYYLEQMKLEVTEADRAYKMEHSDIHLLKSRNKELEAKCRQLEKKLAEEVEMRKVVENKYRQIKRKVRILEEKSHENVKEDGIALERQHHQCGNNAIETAPLSVDQSIDKCLNPSSEPLQKNKAKSLDCLVNSVASNSVVRTKTSSFDAQLSTGYVSPTRGRTASTGVLNQRELSPVPSSNISNNTAASEISNPIKPSAVVPGKLSPTPTPAKHVPVRETSNSSITRKPSSSALKFDPLASPDEETPPRTNSTAGSLEHQQQQKSQVQHLSLSNHPVAPLALHQQQHQMNGIVNNSQTHQVNSAPPYHVYGAAASQNTISQTPQQSQVDPFDDFAELAKRRAPAINPTNSRTL